jgi:hypothetical protein
MSKFAHGKRGPADGPHNSQPFGFDWRFHNSEMRLSAEKGRGLAERHALQEFMKAHPEHKQTVLRERLTPEMAYAHALDLMKRHESEHQRRMQAMMRRTEKHKRKRP